MSHSFEYQVDLIRNGLVFQVCLLVTRSKGPRHQTILFNVKGCKRVGLSLKYAIKRKMKQIWSSETICIDIIVQVKCKRWNIKPYLANYLI